MCVRGAWRLYHAHARSLWLRGGRSEEGDGGRGRDLGDGLLDDVGEDSEHGNPAVPHLALREREELLRARLGDAQRAVVAGHPLVALLLLVRRPCFSTSDMSTPK